MSFQAGFKNIKRHCLIVSPALLEDLNLSNAERCRVGIWWSNWFICGIAGNAGGLYNPIEHRGAARGRPLQVGDGEVC